MDVSIYSEPIVNMKNIMNQWFGQASDPAVYDMLILFGTIIFFIFIFCILGLFFRGGSRR